MELNELLDEKNSILEDKKRITTLENEITELNSDRALQPFRELIFKIDLDIKSKQEELENVKKEKELKQTKLEANIEVFKEEQIAKIEKKLNNYASKDDYVKLENEILNLENEKKRYEILISGNEESIQNTADEFERNAKRGEITLYKAEISKIERKLNTKRLELPKLLSTIEDSMGDAFKLKHLIMRIRGLNSDNLDKVDLSEIDKKKAEKLDAEKDSNETTTEKLDAEKSPDENIVKDKSIYRIKRELQNEIKELKAKNPAEGTKDAKRLSECENELNDIQQKITKDINEHKSELKDKFLDKQPGEEYHQNDTEENTNIAQSYNDISSTAIYDIEIEIIEKGKKEKEIKINGEEAKFKRKLLRRDGMKKEVSKICKQLFEGKRFSKIRARHLRKKLDPAIINAIGKDSGSILKKYIEAIAKKGDLPFDLTYKIQGPQKLKDKKYVRAAKKAKANIVNEHNRKFFSKKEEIKAISSGENVQDSQTHEDSEFKKILRRS